MVAGSGSRLVIAAKTSVKQRIGAFRCPFRLRLPASPAAKHEEPAGFPQRMRRLYGWCG
jgi:hypothetical protein